MARNAKALISRSRRTHARSAQPRLLNLRAALVTAVSLLALGLLWSSAEAGAARTRLVSSFNVKPQREAISVSWGVSSTKGLKGFNLLWRATPARKSARRSIVTLSARARSYEITGLAPGSYEVRVRALSPRGAGRIAKASTFALGHGEEPPAEEPPKEKEPPVEEGEKGKEGGTQTVPATPSGPAAPAGGWSVVYGDAFGEPLGTGAGHDNTIYPNVCEAASCAGFNRDELETFKSTQQAIGGQGLELTCQYTASAPKPYNCGGVYSGAKSSSSHGFTWAAGSGQTLVFQAVSKFPRNTGDADVSWWSDGPPWTGTEFDFYEAENLQHEGWCTGSGLFTAWFAPPHLEKALYNFGCSYDPTAAYHTYTTEIFPDDTFSAWIDGAQYANHIGPLKAVTEAADYLTLSYGIREEGINGFKSGARTYYVKSIEVWEDTKHRGVGIHNEGLAPGTAVSGEAAAASSLSLGGGEASSTTPVPGEREAPASGAAIEPQLQQGSSDSAASGEESSGQGTPSGPASPTPQTSTTETAPSAAVTTPAPTGTTRAGK
jgi:hypothetical protein